MTTFRSSANRSPFRVHASASALILWTCLWFNLNTGFWNFVPPNNAGEWLSLLRSILPFVVVPVSVLLLARSGKLHLPGASPSRFLFIYGGFATFSSVFSPKPLWALYWSTAFLATILAAWTFIDRRESIASARQLLLITWIATFLVALIIGYMARGSIFGDSASGYGVITELNGLSRSSGVARWAAVPGLVCLVRAYYTRRRSLISLYLGAAAVSFFIVYRMQSRGAVFGATAAVIFALLVASRLRRYALPFALVAVVAILYIDPGGTVSNRVGKYLKRGESTEDFETMTGRTRAYREGFAAFEEAPFFGSGQWSDRLHIGEHVHNSFIQAALNSGVFGLVPYIGSWIAGWILFYRLNSKGVQLKQEDRVHLMECGAVMMFFTVRAMPETTTASYAPDLLVMVAVYVYLEALAVAALRKRVNGSLPMLRFVPARRQVAAIRRTG
jgi:O-antigen ligase